MRRKKCADQKAAIEDMNSIIRHVEHAKTDMAAERDTLTMNIAMLSPGAHENTTVANITAFNENVTRASELRKEIV